MPWTGYGRRPNLPDVRQLPGHLRRHLPYLSHGLRRHLRYLQNAVRPADVPDLPHALRHLPDLPYQLRDLSDLRHAVRHLPDAVQSGDLSYVPDAMPAAHLRYM
jgi:hypothetical protein